jgi:MarR family 2-MHQ and catechol resistance regulon transcriptional repressor
MVEPSWSAVTGAIRLQQAASALEHAAAGHLRGHRLKLSQFLMLAVLADAPDATARTTDIATRLGVTTGGVTRLVDRAVRRGYVHRKPNPADKRGVLVTLTSYGRQRLEAATPGFVDLVVGLVVVS